MQNKKSNFGMKKPGKKTVLKQVFEYKTIEGVPDKYLDYFLIESAHEKILRDFYSREKENPILKGIKLKHKVTKNLVSLDIDKLKVISLDYISLDKTRKLYSFLSGASMTMVYDYIKSKGHDFIDGDREEVLANLQQLVKILDIFNLVSFLRIRRDDLHDIIPWLLAKWEESDEFGVADVEDTYGFDASSVDLDAFDLYIDFEEIELDEKTPEVFNSIDLDASGLFNSKNIKSTIHIMKECIEFLGNKVENSEENSIKVEQLQAENEESKKSIAKLEKKVKNRDVRIGDLEVENEKLKQKIEELNKKLIEQLELNKQNKEKLEEGKKEKRELKKQNKEIAEQLEDTKSKLEVKSSEAKKVKELEVGIQNIKNDYEKTLKEVEDSKKEYLQLETTLYSIKKEKEEIRISYEDKLERLNRELKIANEKNTINESKSPIVIDNEPESDTIDEGFEDYGNLFGDIMDNNPTYSR